VHAKSDVTVLGAGVSGLTTAICLAEAGASVAIHAAELPLQTTSVAAGAVWAPHLVGLDSRITPWADRTLARLRELGDAGVPAIHLATGIEVSRTAGSGPPEFASDTAALSALGPDEIPAGYLSGWRGSAPLIAMPDYLVYLYERYLRAGGSPVDQVSYPALTEAAAAAGSPVLVNCTGSGAHGFVPDPSVTPVRGQVVVVANPGITEFFDGFGPDAGDITYFFPHGDRIVLGGTQEYGNWSRDPDPAVAERILAACALVEPALAGATVLAHRVGLRPLRPQVRLESERMPDGTTVVHNYGHGGAGVTLSWGCAQDAAALALDALGAFSD